MQNSLRKEYRQIDSSDKIVMEERRRPRNSWDGLNEGGSIANYYSVREILKGVVSLEPLQSRA